MLAAVAALAGLFANPCFARLECNVVYRVTHARGTLTAVYRGPLSPECNCRLHGHGEYRLRRPAHSPAARANINFHPGLRGQGELWFKPLGSVEAASVGRPDGSSCHRKIRIADRRQYVELYSDGRHVTISVDYAGTNYFAFGICDAPLGTSIHGESTPPSTRVSIATLAHRRVRLHLKAHHSFRTDAGQHGTIRVDMRFNLVRLRCEPVSGPRRRC